MGFRYFGPIDGNDITAVVNTVKNIIDMNEPVLLHVLTKKGKGYSLAERLPEKFHGISCFNVDTGEKIVTKKGDIRSETSFTNTFANKIVDIAERHKDIVAITAAMSEGTGLDKFAGVFPHRFFDVGMAEQHAVGFAAGLARAGLKPVVAIYSTFLQRSYDQIFHDICLQCLNVIFMLDRAGLVGEDGPTHHGVFDMSYLKNIPNITVMAPRDEEELSKMFEWAVSYDKGAIAIRYPRGSSYQYCPNEAMMLRPKADIVLGKAELLKEGADITIFSIGYMSNIALEAAASLASEGISCEVINARFVKPIDIELLLKSILKTKRLVTLEEGVLSGGFGSAVLELIIDKVPEHTIIKNIGLPDKFIEHGDRQRLLDMYGLSAKKIQEAIKREFFYAKHRD